MEQSQLFYKTQKEIPKDEKSINAQLLIRGGFVYKEMAGVYSFLPLGLRVLRKIEKIVREEMNDIGAKEILMTVLQPKHLWEETKRWSEGVGEVMYKSQEGDREVGLGPTHEEMVTDIIRHYVKSYEDLPLYLYQIQTKFRKEPRPRSGLLRGREFLMKDLYSFHATPEDFKRYYEVAKKSYSKFFKRCGLKTIITEATGSGFTKEYTHEFQVLAPGGEDVIVFCPQGDFAQNKEIAKVKAGDSCPSSKDRLKEAKSIEVGNTFPLGTKYSEDMEAFFTDREGRKKPVIMGSYGIGISRVMGAIVEVHHDKMGIIWPKEVSPFQVHLIEILSGGRGSEKIRKVIQRIYQDLQKSNIEVLYDDRKDKTAGEKFAEADLIGIPYRLVVSEKTLRKKCVEIKKRSEKEARLIKIQSTKSEILKKY